MQCPFSTAQAAARKTEWSVAFCALKTYCHPSTPCDYCIQPKQPREGECFFCRLLSLIWRILEKERSLFASLSNMSVICRVVHPTVFLGYKVMSTLLLSGPRLVFREYATRPPSRCFNILSFPPSPHLARTAWRSQAFHDQVQVKVQIKQEQSFWVA